MNNTFYRFLKRLTVFSLIIILISYFSSHLLPSKFISPAIPFIIFFFYLITILVFFILLKASLKKFSRFVNTFMIASFIKLLIYLAVILFYIFLFNKSDKVPFVGAFFIYYIIFTVFETVYIIISTKNN